MLQCETWKTFVNLFIQFLFLINQMRYYIDKFNKTKYTVDIIAAHTTLRKEDLKFVPL